MSLPAPSLHTERLRLRPFSDADADALYALHSNAYVLRYWDSPPWTERSRADRFIAGCRQLAEEGTGLLKDPWWVLLTAIAAGMSVWAWRLFAKARG